MEQEVSKNTDIKDEEKKPTWKKVVSIVLNVIFYLLIAIVLIFAIITLTKKTAKDLPHVFGKGYAIVESDSMEPTFNVGELITVNILNEKKCQDLKIGDVITFFDNNINHLNTHRIIGFTYDENGNISYVRTKGDHSPDADTLNTAISDIKGLWPEKSKTAILDDVEYVLTYDDDGNITGDLAEKLIVTSNSISLSPTVKFTSETYSSRHSVGLGKVVNFITDTEKPFGFILCIILPTIIFLVYAVIVFVKNLLVYKMSKQPSPTKEVTADDKEKIIQEYLAKQALEKQKVEEETK